MDADDTRMIGRRIRRIRTARDKSLQVIAGLAGMSRSTLHRVEHGQRDVTLSEIMALAGALEVAPSTLRSAAAGSGNGAVPWRRRLVGPRGGSRYAPWMAAGVSRAVPVSRC